MAYLFRDLAYEVLKQVKDPLTYHEIWEKAVELGLDRKLKTSGKTPWATLGARLFVDVKDNPNSVFIKVSKNPARFFLKERESELKHDFARKLENRDLTGTSVTSNWSEKDLHPLLTYFVYADPAFGRGKSILTKTINHERSKKRKYSEWLYPDMVGVYLPLEDWETELIELGKFTENVFIRLYSFELKKYLNRGNYREAFFQAVSNSSWAHEGYLVAAEIRQDDEFLAELERLSVSFNIGIIHLDLKNFDNSTVMFPATSKNNLDWETMNKLCAQNKDFRKFIQDVKIDFESKRIHKSEYDRVPEDPDAYLKKLLR